jgi:hypothetical protein
MVMMGLARMVMRVVVVMMIHEWTKGKHHQKTITATLAIIWASVTAHAAP